MLAILAARNDGKMRLRLGARFGGLSHVRPRLQPRHRNDESLFVIAGFSRLDILGLSHAEKRAKAR